MNSNKDFFILLVASVLTALLLVPILPKPASAAQHHFDSSKVPIKLDLAANHINRIVAKDTRFTKVITESNFKIDIDSSSGDLYIIPGASPEFSGVLVTESGMRQEVVFSPKENLKSQTITFVSKALEKPRISDAQAIKSLKNVANGKLSYWKTEKISDSRLPFKKVFSHTRAGIKIIEIKGCCEINEKALGKYFGPIVASIWRGNSLFLAVRN